MDVFGLGREIPGGIQRDEAGVADGAPLLQQPRLIKGLKQILEETEQLTGRNRIEHLADVIVARDACDLKERARIVAAAFLFHGLLETQERRALREEDCEGRQGEVGHGEAGIIARAPIRQIGGDRAEAFDEVIQAVRIHAPRDAGTGSKAPVTIV